MSQYPNITKSGHMASTWIGCAAGTVWRIRKERRGFTAFLPSQGEQFHRQTLIGISNELDRRAKLMISARKGLR